MKSILRPVVLGAALLTTTAAMASVTFYEGENFGGRQVTMDGTVPNFVERGYNDRARSVVVEGAPVEVCVDINFNGGCTVLNPGRYPTLGNLENQISSMRPVRDNRGGYDSRDRGGRGARTTARSGAGGRWDRSRPAIEPRSAPPWPAAPPCPSPGRRRRSGARDREPRAVGPGPRSRS